MKLCLILIAATLLIHGTGYGQDSTSLRNKLFELDRLDRTVRVLVEPPGTMIQGRVMAITDTAVLVGSNRVSLQGVTAIEVLHTKTDPVWNGMVIGVAANALAYYAVLQKFNTLTSTNDDALVVVGVVAAGALFGTLVDLMVGNLETWETAWQKR